MVELSHVWGHGVPSYPGQTDVKMHRAVKHAQHGVLAWRITTIMHTGTHMNAPIHLIQKGADLAGRLRRTASSATAAVLDVPKKHWEVITAADLQDRQARRSRTATSSSSSPAGITSTPTAWSTSARRPGLSKDAAEWLVTMNPQDGRRRHAVHRPPAGDLAWARIAAARR